MIHPSTHSWTVIWSDGVNENIIKTTTVTMATVFVYRSMGLWDVAIGWCLGGCFIWYKMWVGVGVKIVIFQVCPNQKLKKAVRDSWNIWKTKNKVSWEVNHLLIRLYSWLAFHFVVLAKFVVLTQIVLVIIYCLLWLRKFSYKLSSGSGMHKSFEVCSCWYVSNST